MFFSSSLSEIRDKVIKLYQLLFGFCAKTKDLFQRLNVIAGAGIHPVTQFHLWFLRGTLQDNVCALLGTEATI